LGFHLHLQRGAVDYAGSAAVHLLGGTIGLLGAIVIRPRLGKFDREGTPRPILGHDVPMVMLGALLAMVAWVGFTTSRSFLLSDGKAPLIAVNTLLAAMGGAVGAAGYMWFRFGRPDPSLTCNGLVAGLVAVSAGCAWVAPLAALTIGVIGGVVAIIAVLFLERRGIDDPVGVASTHGIAGAWGMLSLGLLADGTTTVQGLFHGGGFGLLLCQLIAVAAIVLLALAGGGIAFWLINRITLDARVSTEIEFAGLDIPETGAPGYPEFVSSHGPESFGGGSMR
jgi:Amt family ammonium transporter